MAKTRPWTVAPHDPIEKHESNLWSVGGKLPSGNMLRRMAIARLSDGGLVFYNAVPLREPEMQALESWGKPAFLIVPNGFHRLDIQPYKTRYPALKILCPAPAAARVRAEAPVDGDLTLLPPDPAVRTEALSGLKTAEPVMIVESGGAHSLVFGDAVFNLPHLPGIDGALFKLLGSTDGPRVTNIARWLIVAEKPSFRAHLERLAALPGLRRWIPSHGSPVESDAAGVLKTVAATL